MADSHNPSSLLHHPWFIAFRSLTPILYLPSKINPQDYCLPRFGIHHHELSNSNQQASILAASSWTAFAPAMLQCSQQKFIHFQPTSFYSWHWGACHANFEPKNILTMYLSWRITINTSDQANHQALIILDLDQKGNPSYDHHVYFDTSLGPLSFGYEFDQNLSLPLAQLTIRIEIDTSRILSGVLWYSIRRERPFHLIIKNCNPD